MQISAATSNTLDTLCKLDYRITNIYTDGAVRMSNGTVGVFVRPDGSVTPPHTSATQAAQAALHEAGVNLVFGVKD